LKAEFRLFLRPAALNGLILKVLKFSKSWSWVLLIGLTILIKLASWYPDWVERNYSQKVYPVISRIQRFLFGWAPISIGDIFYGLMGLLIIYKTYRFFRTIFKKQFTRTYFIKGLQQVIFFFLSLYVFFNLLWGLNYNRRGIAHQLGLEVKEYSMPDLDTLAVTIHQRVSYYAQFVSEEQRDTFDRKRMLFSGAFAAYKEAEKKFPFLKYHGRSIKPSLFSYLGNYLGFQGYYNPFSGEAQVNTTVPRFLEPYVSAHEIAHQLGYGKENEANFVGFLACRSYESNAFRYSVYYDMYNYTIGELYRSNDTTLARTLQQTVHPQVKKDQKEYRDFYRRYHNPIENVVMWGYGQYLKANNQPAGKRSYNEVVTWLIAYYKKYGLNEL